MRTYVSIDLDFFNGMSPDVVESTLDNFFASALRRRVPMVAVMNHQQLTRFVDESCAKKLINIDMHADIVDSDVQEFNCGTWISFVRWRHRGHYHWVHRHSVGDGECSWADPIFMGLHNQPRTRGHITDWKRVSRRKVVGFPYSRTLLSNCVSVGFVLSPYYVDAELEPVFRTLVKRYQMRYIRGIRNEDFHSVSRTPPKRRGH